MSEGVKDPTRAFRARVQRQLYLQVQQHLALCQEHNGWHTTFPTKQIVYYNFWAAPSLGRILLDCLLPVPVMSTTLQTILVSTQD